MKSIRYEILEHFLSGCTLTVTQAILTYHTTELRKIVSDLRAEGYEISDEWMTNDVDVEYEEAKTKKRWKEYFIMPNQIAREKKKYERS